MKKKETVEHGPIGGIPFFLSLFFLFVLTFLNLIILPVILDTSSLPRWLVFLIAMGVGASIAARFIQGRLSVFLHEMKHSILSNLAGNRAKGMKVQTESGHFEYAYSKKTAYMNALIALAPYFFPILLVPTLLISYALFFKYPYLPLAFAGVAYGADLWISFRDISPHQTDLTEIRGGYHIAVLYIGAMTATLFTFLAAWVSGDVEGIKFLFYGLLKFGERVSGMTLGV